MKQTYLLESVMGQNRLAVVEEGDLQELYYERPGQEKLSGNIYVGRVENVLPGMNAAFVDIGLDKNAFLAAGDIQIDVRGDKALADKLGSMRIEKMLRPGQEIIVQVIKEPGGTKGPRISCHITLPGRRMVLLPGVKYVGVSKKITGAIERDRLHGIGKALTQGDDNGLIIRTAAQDVDEKDLAREYAAVTKMWDDICRRGRHAVPPCMIHSDGSLALRAIRDMLSEDTCAIVTDDEPMYRSLTDFAELFAPDRKDVIAFHESDTPLFDLYRVDTQADKCYGRHVWLKSGGSLVIEETEALTVIDVNTGKFTGKKSLEETIFKTNCEAAEEIMRQIRLRDIGGIIIVDFIDMDTRERKQELLDIMRLHAKRDRNHTNVQGITSLGLVEMTRKKVRQPMSKQLMHICSDCGGNGTVPSYETTARKIARDIWRRARMGQTCPVLVEAIEPVLGWMKTVGLPEGIEAYGAPRVFEKAWEYRISPADENSIRQYTNLLK